MMDLGAHADKFGEKSGLGIKTYIIKPHDLTMVRALRST